MEAVPAASGRFSLSHGTLPQPGSPLCIPILQMKGLRLWSHTAHQWQNRDSSSDLPPSRACPLSPHLIQPPAVGRMDEGPTGEPGLWGRQVIEGLSKRRLYVPFVVFYIFLHLYVLSSLRHVGSLVAALGILVEACGNWFPNKGSHVPPASEEQSSSHWTIREVSNRLLEDFWGDIQGFS